MQVQLARQFAPFETKMRPNLLFIVVAEMLGYICERDGSSAMLTGFPTGVIGNVQENVPYFYLKPWAHSQQSSDIQWSIMKARAIQLHDHMWIEHREWDHSGVTATECLIENLNGLGGQ